MKQHCGTYKWKVKILCSLHNRELQNMFSLKESLKKKKKILGVIRPLIQLCGFLNILVHLSDCSLVNAPFMSYLEVHS